MELTYFPAIPPAYRDQIRDLLILADKEFIPPLSARSSSTQKDLSGVQDTGGIDDYFAAMVSQPVVLALEGAQVLGFMALRKTTPATRSASFQICTPPPAWYTRTAAARG